MSRNHIIIDAVEAVHKSSGLLVATGAGSGSWFRSETALPPFDAAAKEARYTNLALSATGSTEHSMGFLREGQTLNVQSLNDSDGIVALDSLIVHPFGRGAKIHIRLAEMPLYVASRLAA